MLPPLSLSPQHIPLQAACRWAGLARAMSPSRDLPDDQNAHLAAGALGGGDGLHDLVGILDVAQVQDVAQVRTLRAKVRQVHRLQGAEQSRILSAAVAAFMRGGTLTQVRSLGAKVRQVHGLRDLDANGMGISGRIVRGETMNLLRVQPLGLLSEVGHSTAATAAAGAPRSRWR